MNNSLIRTGILGHCYDNKDLENYKIMLSKRLKVDKELIDKLTIKSIKVRNYIKDREERKSYWDYLSYFRNFLLTLNESELDMLRKQTIESCRSVDQGGVNYNTFLIATIDSMVRDINKYSIGKYVNTIKKHIHLRTFRDITLDIFKRFFYDLKIKGYDVRAKDFVFKEIIYNNKKVELFISGGYTETYKSGCITNPDFKYILATDFHRRFGYNSYHLLMICGLLIDAINNNKVDEFKKYINIFNNDSSTLIKLDEREDMYFLYREKTMGDIKFISTLD